MLAPVETRLIEERKMRATVLVVLGSLMLGTALPAFAGDTLGFADVKTAVAYQRIHLIDVREADEFAAGHVPGAVNLPLSSFKAEDLPPASDVPVALMCRSGHRAGQALAIAEAAGRTDVGIYAGSMIDWTKNGGPIVTGR
jgi:rhodanese-related sulfurtransferase